MNQSDNSTNPQPGGSANTTRRQFIQTGALAATSFFIVPRHVLGGKGFIAPSDKLNIAGVGVAGKGFSDTNNAFNKGANNMVALCDVDWNRDQVKKNFEQHPTAKRYKDFREMLDKEGKNIDAVTVSTADHTHAVIAMAAMQRGKHVYVQKPLTHNIYEARMLTEAARKYKVVTQMGNQGSSNPQQKQMVEWYDKGLIGKVHTVHLWTNRPVWPQGIPVPQGAGDVPSDLDWDTWIGPAQKVGYSPAYHPFKWRGWWNFGLGCALDFFATFGVHFGIVAVHTADYQAFVANHQHAVFAVFRHRLILRQELRPAWTDAAVRPVHSHGLLVFGRGRKFQLHPRRRRTSFGNVFGRPVFEEY